VIYYCDSTTIRQVISVKEGEKDSDFIEFYENGVLKTNGYYDKGVLNGDYISNYEDGKVKCVGVQYYGRFIGSCFKYWDSGMVAEIRTTTSGFPIFGHVLYLDETGREITKEKFDILWWK
jgi:antitoxin component YwqK of YwqJK toxin-antitoxin module